MKNVVIEFLQDFVTDVDRPKAVHNINDYLNSTLLSALASLEAKIEKYNVSKASDLDLTIGCSDYLLSEHQHDLIEDFVNKMVDDQLRADNVSRLEIREYLIKELNREARRRGQENLKA